ncbi:MAG: signal recognition particle-docking protein FtsY, partial [Algiphilus sp.]
KTTTIGKLAARYKAQGRKVLLAAGDTFRAAATDQLRQWAQRIDVPIVAQQEGADPASVIFDAVTSATQRGADLVIADTAGRLHTQSHLMEELRKVKRVIQKHDPYAPHESLLVLDGTQGGNGLVQAKQFHEALGLTGVAVTKLDGTARGGILLALAKQLSLPVRYIGIGESVDDLIPFDAAAFSRALVDGANGARDH